MNTVEVIEKIEAAEFKAANRCPYYDNDCKDVIDHLKCWSDPEGTTGDAFPGVCPFVFGMEK